MGNQSRSKDYRYAVYIGRFQPPHKGHFRTMIQALKLADTLIIVIGSAYSARTIKNPWTAKEREQMILTGLSPREREQVKFVHVMDQLYSDNLWISEIQTKVYQAIGENVKPGEVALVGIDKDKSTYYLNLFPQWIREDVFGQPDRVLNATDIRSVLFASGPGQIDQASIVPNVKEYIKTWITNHPVEYTNLCSEFKFIVDYKVRWATAPFPPTFVTVDNVLLCHGHILVVKRKVAPGKGLLALPGGFLNQGERCVDGAIRELKEETRIEINGEVLRSVIFDSMVADHPDRSLRGRTLSHVFYYDLNKIPHINNEPTLPEVIGADDAEKAMWLPFNECVRRSDEFFEDHLDIAVRGFYSRR